jgi:hypothetical protein
MRCQGPAPPANHRFGRARRGGRSWIPVDSDGA